MIQLVLAALEGLVKIGIGTYEDAQKSEVDRLAALQEWFERGAEATRDLVAAHAKNVDEVEAAFAAARARLSVQAFASKVAAVLANEDTTQP